MGSDSEKTDSGHHGMIEGPHAAAGLSSRSRQVILAIAFAALFHLLDSATAIAQKSAAASAFYLPVGLVIALVLWGGPSTGPWSSSAS